MSDAVVLDASAAMRAVMDGAAQPALLDCLCAATTILAPTLLRAEVGNALLKYQRSGVISLAEALRRHEEAVGIVHLLIDDSSLFPETLSLAAEMNHPVYDALYAVTARRHAAMLLSFDQRLHALCQRAGIPSTLLSAL